MKLFRITKQKYAKDLSGKGAKLFGGRWNPIGVSALYCSETRALAVLELLVHTRNEILPKNLRIITIEIPTKFKSKIIQIENLPNDWNSLQTIEATQKIGKNYFNSNNCLGIKVPSAVIEMEMNIVLNPNFKNYHLLEIESIDKFILDKRLLR